MKIVQWMAAVWIIAMLHACGGGGGSSGTAPFGNGGTSGGTPPTPSMTMAISSNTVTTAASATVSAKVVDAAGNAVPDQVVSFSTTQLGVFNATTGLTATALTDASGIATVKLSPAPATAAGADSVVATATVSGTSLTASIGFQSAGGAATPTQAKSLEVLASSNQFGSGGDVVTITANVKDAGNVSLASQPVVFSSDSGTLTAASATTNDSGIATATLSAGANRSNRSILVTVASGAVQGQVSVDVAGTTLSYSGVTTIGLGNSAHLTVKAVDSKSVPISGLSVQVASSLGNGLSSASLTTDSQGSASFDYTANKAGSDTLTFSGGGATTASTTTISGEDFVFISPAANTLIPVGTSKTVTVRYLSGGVPQAGKSVAFAATAGTVTGASATTDSNGKASATVMSTTSSPATVQATLQGGLALATLPVTFVATTPASLVLQVSPAAIGPNPNGSTAQRALLLATVRDANNNPVQGITVNFSRLTDPSGGNLLQPSATTDSSGQASVQYAAGGLTTASNGVQFRATTATTVPVSGDASMTVNQSALFIALGTGNKLVELDTQTNQQNWVVYVTDANGAVVPNVNLTMKVLPVDYFKGTMVQGSKAWIRSPRAVQCANEDSNYNGVLDPGEDISTDGKLEPGNVTLVSPGNVTTDATGRATISLIYAKSYANWLDVTLQAMAVVSGTESSTQSTFPITGIAADYSDLNVSPPGETSPFGVGACTQPF